MLVCATTRSIDKQCVVFHKWTCTKHVSPILCFVQKQSEVLCHITYVTPQANTHAQCALVVSVKHQTRGRKIWKKTSKNDFCARCTSSICKISSLEAGLVNFKLKETSKQNICNCVDSLCNNRQYTVQ